MALDTLSNDAARVRVGGTRLGELTGLRREHALRAVASLVRRGLVRRAVRGHSGRGARRTSNEYEMLAPEAAAATEPEEPD
jgi:sRNA-binding protein